MAFDRYECAFDPQLVFPGGQRPPELYAYPEPCHPVRLLCWTESTFPGFGRSRKRGDRSRVGLPLLRACGRLHLPTEFRDLNPQRVCALGQVAFLALAEVWKTIPAAAKPTQGRLFSRSEYGLSWDLLYTAFPSSSPAGLGATESLRAVAKWHLSKLLA